MIRIATRKSALALWQAHYLADRLRSLPAAPEVELVPIVTIGDANQTDALRQFGGTGVFTLEVQKAVLDGRAEIAVHSLKDLPTLSADGLVLAAVPERERRCDALLLPLTVAAVQCLDDIPHGAKIGTGSPRRQAQLLHLRPDLKLCEIRGNVDTRIRKLDEGQYDAIVLAEAGLRRLELAGRISLMLEPPSIPPSAKALWESNAALRIKPLAHCCNRSLVTQLLPKSLPNAPCSEHSALVAMRHSAHGHRWRASDLH